MYNGTLLLDILAETSSENLSAVDSVHVRQLFERPGFAVVETHLVSGIPMWKPQGGVDMEGHWLEAFDVSRVRISNGN
ncbi:hypothetical protein L914_15413, partial [Phytophthora nicotianae]